MKGFIISIIMLSLVIGLTVMLSVYGYNASQKLAEKADFAYKAAENEHRRAAEDISALWEKHLPILSLSLHKSEIEKTSTMITTIRELSYTEHDTLTYKTLCKLLYEQFLHEKELHAVTLDGVF